MGQTRQASFDDWRTMLTADNTADTVQHYASWVKRFEHWRDDDPGRDNVVEFDALLRDGDAIQRLSETAAEWGDPWANARPPSDGYAYRTRVMAASAVKSWLEFAHEIEFGGAAADRVQNMVRGDEPDFDPEVAPPETVRDIIAETRGCTADSCHTMTRLGYDAIMRPIEVCRVRWDDLDMERGTVYVRAAKGSNNRHVALHDSTLEALEEYRGVVLDRFDDPEYLFYSFYMYKYNKPWSPKAWGQHFCSRHFEPGFHAFARHSAITNRLNNGQSLSEVSQRARHKNLETTKQYSQFVGNGADPLPELE